MTRGDEIEKWESSEVNNGQAGIEFRGVGATSDSLPSLLSL